MEMLVNISQTGMVISFVVFVICILQKDIDQKAKADNIGAQSVIAFFSFGAIAFIGWIWT